MVSKLYRIFLVIIVSAAVAGTVACDQINERMLSASLPSCESQREVAGWDVTAGLEKTNGSDVPINKWKVSRDFSTFFGVRIAYDTSESLTPYLEIWHDYKSGDFAMRFPDGVQLTTSLNANYAVTTASLREIDATVLGRQPVRIEHTPHAGPWKVYQTDGLPEAIAAAKSNLDVVKENLKNKECSL